MTITNDHECVVSNMRYLDFVVNKLKLWEPNLILSNQKNLSAVLQHHIHNIVHSAAYTKNKFLEMVEEQSDTLICLFEIGFQRLCLTNHYHRARTLFTPLYVGMRQSASMHSHQASMLRWCWLTRSQRSIRIIDIWTPECVKQGLVGSKALDFGPWMSYSQNSLSEIIIFQTISTLKLCAGWKDFNYIYLLCSLNP
jgi:hypothetical protein